jgi:hypothetical protein
VADHLALQTPATAELALPEPNMFIPSDLKLVTPTPVDEVSSMLFFSPLSRR